MNSPPNSGLPIYAETMAQVMANSSTPTPRHRSRRIVRNPYVDDEAVECEDLDD